MDERLSKALEFSNFRISLFNKKESIRLKMNSMLTYAINGGIFKAKIETINFLKLLIDEGKDQVVLIDLNGNPVEITNIKELYNELLSRYFQATNFYYVEYDKIRKARTVKTLMSELFDEDNT